MVKVVEIPIEHGGSTTCFFTVIKLKGDFYVFLLISIFLKNINI